MPALETFDRYQTCLYWPFTGDYDNFGNPVIDIDEEPAEIKVRWTNKKSRVMDAQGNTIMLDATAVIDQDMKVGDVLWLGTLSEWNGTGTSSGSSASDDELMQVKTYSRWPDIKDRNIRRIVGMMRYKNTLSNG